jgi:hypothetical protein
MVLFMSNTDFETAVLNLVTEQPRLVNDIIQDLRDKGWKRLNEQTVIAVIRDFGGYIGSRKHGAGNAKYAASVAFTQVTDFNGKVHTVEQF